MAAPLTNDLYADFVAAVEDSDSEKIRELLLVGEFILISVEDEVDDEDDAAIGALTADLDDLQVLVIFSNEEHAGTFVNEMSEMFTEGEEVQGFMVEGDALLEYLPEDYGMLFNPETEDAVLVPPALADEIRGEDEQISE